MKQHTVREAWLEDAVRHLEPVFSKAGYAIPPVRVSCGFPASSSPRTTLGQCWPRERSGGGVNEIFISPKLDEPVQLLDTLVHELCHAVDDCLAVMVRISKVSRKQLDSRDQPGWPMPQKN